MSAGAQPQKGPAEERLEFIWDKVWDSYAKGEVCDFFTAQAEVDLIEFRRAMAPNDANALADLARAESHDRAQRSHFNATIKHREEDRKKIFDVTMLLTKQMMHQANFVMQSLALANGSVVLATLSYIGGNSSGGIQLFFVALIVLGGLGFLLTLLMAYVGISRAGTPVQQLAEMARPLISEDRATSLKNDYQKYAAASLRIATILGFSAAACLVLALAIGTAGLLNAGAVAKSHPSLPPVETDEN